MTRVATSTINHVGGVASPAAGCRAAVILTVVLVGLVYWFSPNFQLHSSPNASPFAGDFLQEWIGGYVVISGEADRLYDPLLTEPLQHDASLVGFEWDNSRYLPMVYPPFYYLVISPISALPFQAAAWLWAGLMFGCFAISWAFLYRAQKHRLGLFGYQDKNRSLAEVDRRARWESILPWTLPLAIFFVPLLENFTSSQKGALCLLILTATFVLLDRSRPLAAGLVFGLLAFKPQLTLVIAVAMLFKGQWRFVAGGAITGAVLVGASLVTSPSACGDYFLFSLGTSDYLNTAGYDLHKSHCLWGFFNLLSGGDATIIAKVATFTAAGGVIYLLWKTLREGIQAGTPRLACQFSALVLATVLLSPHFFTYDLTILLLPIMLLGYLISQRLVAANLRRPVIWLLVGLLALSGISPLLAQVTHVQLTPLLIISLLIVLARQSAQLTVPQGNDQPSKPQSALGSVRI